MYSIGDVVLLANNKIVKIMHKTFFLGDDLYEDDETYYNCIDLDGKCHYVEEYLIKGFHDIPLNTTIEQKFTMLNWQIKHDINNICKGLMLKCTQ